MPRELRRAVVVVTGGSSGIGRATAPAFARAGAAVVVGARRERPLDTVALECGRAPAPRVRARGAARRDGLKRRLAA